jgi:hypothetical protein
VLDPQQLGSAPLVVVRVQLLAEGGLRGEERGALGREETHPNVSWHVL